MDKPSDVTYSYKICRKSPRLSIDNLFELIKENQNDSISIQVIDPTWIVSKKHLQAAVYHTLKAFKNGRNIARGSETELLIRLSGFRQIKKAVKAFGINDQTNTLLIIAFGGTCKDNESILERFFSNTNLEQIENTQLPITDIQKLLEYYGYEKDSILLEKEVLEKIATVEIS
ncbi:MAG: hypothetical protein KAJ30_03185 [Candidatus Heimdallarchaeota archaeon]|nr:hypothetical protein [Candidatus Heimdallarchaeota archaeon]